MEFDYTVSPKYFQIKCSTESSSDRYVHSTKKRERGDEGRNQAVSTSFDGEKLDCLSGTNGEEDEGGAEPKTVHEIDNVN